MSFFLRLLRKYANRPWFLPILCLAAAVDLFIVVIPIEPMVIMATVMRPRNWLRTGFAVATASGIGAIALTLTARVYGEPFVDWVAGAEFLHSTRWIQAQNWVASYGFWAVLITALGPLPQQLVVLIAGLAGMPIPSIFLGVWLGRLPKYTLAAYLASRGERWIREEITKHPVFKKFPRFCALLLKIVHQQDA